MQEGVDFQQESDGWDLDLNPSAAIAPMQICCSMATFVKG